MVYIYSLIFIITMALGGTFAWMENYTPVQWVMAMTISGFIGSSIIALMFTFFYFFRKETDQEKVQRLEDEVIRLKQQKQLKRLE